MSCNGCRVLRKGCSESCVLRPCLQWIDTAESQGHATVFVARFFGRAGLMSFISAVPESQRPALFQSLLFEACGRTINPINGAVGLLWTGKWNLCQEAVETVLRGGSLAPLADLDGVELAHGRMKKKMAVVEQTPLGLAACDLDLSLSSSSAKSTRRPTTPSEGSSVTSGGVDRVVPAATLLNLFV